MEEERRISDRLKVGLYVECRKPATAVDAIILDISPGGCRLVTIDRLQEGSTVQIQFPGRRPIAATVSWSEESVAGLQFKYPLPAEVLRRVTTERQGAPSSRVA